TFDAQPASPTNQTTSSFTFHASKAATFQCSTDGAAAANCSSPISVGPLLAGSHTFKVTATDSAGNSGSSTASWTIDVTPPTVSFDAQPAPFTNQTSFDFAFHASKTATFQCSVDGVA